MLDPTGTKKLRDSFKCDLQKRWVALFKLTNEAIITHDILGLKGPTVHSIIAAWGRDRVKEFQQWIDEAMRQIVFGNDGRWMNVYLERADHQAIARVQKLLDRVVYDTIHSQVSTLISATHVELQGIMEAVSQQAVRQVSNGLLAKWRPAKIARSITSIIKSIGQSRSMGLADFSIVKVFNESTLDVLEVAGVRNVGVVPELLLTPALNKNGARVYSKTDLNDAKRKSRAVFQEVDVLTAGDQKVCKICLKISENGPYTIAEARGLIPNHINCRCSFVVAGDLPLFQIKVTSKTNQPQIAA